MLHSIIKSKFAKFSFFVVLFVTISLFISPNQGSLNASSGCHDEWRVVGSSCGCAGNLCFNYKELRRYLVCEEGTWALDDWKSEFQCISWGGCGCN